MVIALCMFFMNLLKIDLKVKYGKFIITSHKYFASYSKVFCIYFFNISSLHLSSVFNIFCRNETVIFDLKQN